MHDVNVDFYRQQYHLLMRAVCTAINELDQNAPELARNTLTTAWDNAVETGFQRLLSETTPCVRVVFFCLIVNFLQHSRIFFAFHSGLWYAIIDLL